MADVLIFETNKPARYLKSVNTPDYPDAVVNPDLSAVDGVNPLYWKERNGSIVEMTPSEVG